MDPAHYQILASDAFPAGDHVIRMDARHTTYLDGELAVVVLDPPYGNASTTPRRDGIKTTYNLGSVMTPRNIKQFYIDTMNEALRILKHRGILIVKCQNFVDGSKSHWMEELIWMHAMELGFRADGKINMVPPGKPIIRHRDRPQQHERKNHSVFWIFRKVRKSEAR